VKTIVLDLPGPPRNKNECRIVEPVEEACATNHFQSFEMIVNFIDAKLVHRDTSITQYRISAEADDNAGCIDIWHCIS
jgi:hypothetical protein